MSIKPLSTDRLISEEAPSVLRLRQNSVPVAVPSPEGETEARELTPNQWSLIIFFYIFKAMYIFELGRWIANIPEKMENEFTSMLLFISITFHANRGLCAKNIIKLHHFA